MSDFVSVWLRVPLRGRSAAGRGERPRTVMAPFRAEVAVVSGSDAPVVARVSGRDRRDDSPIEFRSVDGRLFRPFLREGTTRVSSFNEDDPLTIGLAPSWNQMSSRHPDTPHNPGPFRDLMLAHLPDLSTVTRGRAGYDSLLEDARIDVARLSGSMAVVDGVLHHETRSPCWTFGYGEGCGPRPVIPDNDWSFGAPLIDPSYDVGEVMALLADAVPDFGTRPRGTRIVEILDPSSVPRTVPVDAVGAAARSIAMTLLDVPVRDVERGALREVLALDEYAEAAAKGVDVEGNVARASEAMRALAARARPGTRMTVPGRDLTARLASLCVDQVAVDAVLERMEPTYGADADALATAFA